MHGLHVGVHQSGGDAADKPLDRRRILLVVGLRSLNGNPTAVFFQDR